MVVNHLSEALLEFAVTGNATIVLLDNGAQPKCVTAETEYMVKCVKHIFDDHVIFQFTVDNTIEDQMLEKKEFRN